MNLRELRRQGKMPDEVSLVRDVINREIKIYTDAGRMQRPLFIVENNELKITKKIIEQLKNDEILFSDLLKMGIVEFLDVEEEETAMISMYV